MPDHTPRHAPEPATAAEGSLSPPYAPGRPSRPRGGSRGAVVRRASLAVWGVTAAAGCSAPEPAVVKVNTVPAPRADTVAADVKRAVAADPSLRDYSLAVTARDGTLLLEGQVSDARHRERIAGLARDVAGPGVEVVDRMTILLPEPDSAVTERVRDALDRSTPRGSSGLSIETVDRVVTVRGRRASGAEVGRVLSTILNVDGVKNVTNRLEITGEGGRGEPPAVRP